MPFAVDSIAAKRPLACTQPVDSRARVSKSPMRFHIYSYSGIMAQVILMEGERCQYASMC